MGTEISQLRAVGLALAGYTCWVLADTCLKIAGGVPAPPYELIGGIGVATVVLMLLVAAVRRNFGALRGRSLRAQVLRACLDLANNLCVVVALRHLPLPLFYILVFLAPMVTSLLAVVFLRERLPWQKAMAILLGFAGVVVAVDPFGAQRAGDWQGYAASMVCVAAFSANIVWTRRLTQRETPESLLLYSGVVQAAFGGVLMLAVRTVPLPARTGGVLGLIAACGLLGGLCFLLALRSAAAATVTQFHYSQLVTGALLAWVIWGERLTHAMLAGAVLIIGAGLYTAARSYAQPDGKPADGAEVLLAPE